MVEACISQSYKGVKKELYFFLIPVKFGHGKKESDSARDCSGGRAFYS